MTKGDGKNKFYRTLKLNKEDRKILKDYRWLKEQMDKNPKSLEEENEN